MTFTQKFSLVLALCFVPGAALFAHSVDIPGGAKSLKPGRYTAIVKLDRPRAAKDGVEADIIVPAGVSSPAPAIVFIHGNARNKDFYKTAANFLVAPAAVRKAVVITIQNWWPLSGDKLEATEDTRRALNILIHRLVDAGAIQGNRVYLSGFSAGGLAALATFLQSIDHFRNEAYKQKFLTSWASLIKASRKDPDDFYYNFRNPGKEAGFYPYAGIMYIKGNFYNKFFSFVNDPIMNAEETRKHYAVLTADKKIILTVGGDKEAKDVVKEVPACRGFLKNLGMRLDYHEFGDEGHNIDKSSVELLWQMMP